MFVQEIISIERGSTSKRFVKKNHPSRQKTRPAAQVQQSPFSKDREINEHTSTFEQISQNTAFYTLQLVWVLITTFNQITRVCFIHSLTRHKKYISLATFVKVSSSDKSFVTVLRKPITQLYSEQYSTSEYNYIWLSLLNGEAPNPRLSLPC